MNGVSKPCAHEKRIGADFVSNGFLLKVKNKPNV